MDSSGELTHSGIQSSGLVHVNEFAPQPVLGRALSRRSVKDMRGAGQAFAQKAADGFWVSLVKRCHVASCDAWQSLYHFTVGGATVDQRLSVFAPYQVQP